MICKFNTCVLCVGLSMKFDGIECHEKYCPYDDTDLYYQAYNEFGEFIEYQVDLVREKINNGSLMVGEDVEWTCSISIPISKQTC